MTTGPNCPGLRTADSVRPIEFCQPCACWLRTSGPVIAPRIVIEYRGDMPVMTCTRREPVKG